MDILRRVSKNQITPIPAALSHLPWRAVANLWVLEISESAPDWPLVHAWATDVQAFQDLRTVFTRDEVDHAAWLRMRPTMAWGYPQPEAKFGYLEVTYDLSDYCAACGMGKTQKAPFRVRSEPKWRADRIAQMNWVFDEYFVRPVTWESVFKPFGIAYREVHNRRGEKIETVVQLAVPEEVPIRTEGLERKTCSKCGRAKYLPFKRGFFPAPTLQPSAHVVRTTARFGGGGLAAFSEILISQALAVAFRQHRMKGVSLDPASSEQAPAAPAPSRPVVVAGAAGEPSESDVTASLIALSDSLFRRCNERGYDGLNVAERKVFCIDSVLREVNNGGFSQFFFNSSGDHAADTTAALRAIGADEWADIVRDAIALFPGGLVPSDLQERRAVLVDVGDALEELWVELDDEFAATSGDLEVLLFRYAESVRGELGLP